MKIQQRPTLSILCNRDEIIVKESLLEDDKSVQEVKRLARSAKLG
jgi:hypothetical protein